MSIIESIKSFASDEKVQMFALGALTGVVATGTIAYFCGKSEVVIADTVKAAESEAPKAEEPKPEDKTDPNNPKGEPVE